MWILERHGELFQGDFEHVPSYGGPAEGIWVPEVDFERVGLPPPPTGEMWTPVGSVPSDGGKVLPFLKEFRRVVEGTGTSAEKLARVKSMMDSDPGFEAIGKRFASEFPESWFYSRLALIPGIGPKIARNLFRAGIHDADALKSAHPDAILDVPGVGPKTVDSIKRFVGAA